MNTPVRFEIAKLLKEKGQNIISSKLLYASNGKLTDGIYDFDNWCFAPTIAEVVMWLYEKHRIWISVLQHTKSGKGIYFESVINVMTFSGYNSPTEAYEAAIEYTLKNLLP